MDVSPHAMILTSNHASERTLGGCNVNEQTVLGFVLFQAIFPFGLFPSFPFHSHL